MWVKTQSQKNIYKCIGFELGYHGYGKESECNTIIYGITDVPNSSYTRVTLGVYGKEKAELIFQNIETAVYKQQAIFEMPD